MCVIVIVNRDRNFKHKHITQELSIALIPVTTLIKQVDGGDSHHALNVVDSP